VFRYSSEIPKGPWDHLAIVSWPLAIFIAIVNFGILLSATGASIGMWLTGLKACTVWYVPGQASALGGHYFVKPTLSQALTYAVWHSIVDMLFLGIGHASTNRNQLSQTYGAIRARFVVIEHAWGVRLHQAKPLGHAAKQVVPEPLVPVRRT
jgi:hypothetical protein